MGGHRAQFPVLIPEIENWPYVPLKNYAEADIKVGFSPSKNFLVIYFNGSPLNAFYFISKALSVFEIFTSMSWLFGYVEKSLDKKAMGYFKIYGVTDWTTND